MPPPIPQSAQKSITRLLSSPGKVANALDWTRSSRGSVLSLHMGRESFDLAITLHPCEQAPVQPLASIPLRTETRRQSKSKVLKAHVLEELADLVNEWNVCGFIVSWPVQKEGWCGASCGKVLHTLDQILQETDILKRNRPVCLWDGHHHRLAEDEWGRIPLYGRIPSSDKTRHVASQEQYCETGMLAAGVARDYIEHHWPVLARGIQPPQDSLLGLASEDADDIPRNLVFHSSLFFPSQHHHNSLMMPKTASAGSRRYCGFAA